MPVVNRSKKRGQSLSEFVLLIAIVVAAVTAFQKTALPYIAGLLGAQKSQAETRAWKGGARDLRIFYRNGCAKGAGAC